MRTTINLRAEALALAKAKALEADLPLGEVVSEAILAAYGTRPAPRRGKPFDLPVSGQGGVRPGVDLADSAGLEDVMGARE